MKTTEAKVYGTRSKKVLIICPLSATSQPSIIPLHGVSSLLHVH